MSWEKNWIFDKERLIFDNNTLDHSKNDFKENDKFSVIYIKVFLSTTILLWISLFFIYFVAKIVRHCQLAMYLYLKENQKAVTFLIHANRDFQEKKYWLTKKFKQNSLVVSNNFLFQSYADSHSIIDWLYSILFYKIKNNQH